VACLRVLIAAFDGLQPSQVRPGLTPTIHRLARDGVTFARHHAVFPTVTRVNAASMVAPAAVKVECPEMYSGNGGVTTLGAW